MTMTPAIRLRALRFGRHRHASAAADPYSTVRVPLQYTRNQTWTPYISSVRPPTWCRSFCHVVPQPDLPHHLALSVLAERARDPAVFFQQTQLLHRNMTGFLLCTTVEGSLFGGTRMCACAAEQRCRVGVGGISGDGLYLTVVVDTHELVKMLRLVVVLVLVLGEYLATLVHS